MVSPGNTSGYLVPRQPLRHSLTVVNSRFVSSIRRVDSVKAARAGLGAIRAEMPDASHHVYAFRVGHGKSVTEGMSDDGEPSGTAGPPVLAVLRGSGIGDILVVVTRYFGGTKLGTGGLVRAYSEAARQGLARLQTELKIDRHMLGFEVSYALYEQASQLVTQFDGEITETDFSGTVTIYARFPVAGSPAFALALRELSAGRSEVILLD